MSSLLPKQSVCLSRSKDTVNAHLPSDPKSIFRALNMAPYEAGYGK